MASTPRASETGRPADGSSSRGRCRAVALQEPAVALPKHGASARGDDETVSGGEPLDHLRFEVAEMRLPVPGEDVGNRSSGLSDDQLIHVDEGTVEEFRQSSCDLRLAAAGHAEEDQIRKLQRHVLQDVLRGRIG